jgi:hypothetical protein
MPEGLFQASKPPGEDEVFRSSSIDLYFILFLVFNSLHHENGFNGKRWVLSISRGEAVKVRKIGKNKKKRIVNAFC